jgi:hypothetical protein
VTDPEDLVMSAEPTARLSELAAMFDVSSNALRIVLQFPDCDRVRFARCKPARETRYAIDDVRAVVAKHRVWFDERRRHAAELETSQRAARARSKAANEAKAAARLEPRKPDRQRRGP